MEGRQPVAPGLRKGMRGSCAEEAIRALREEYKFGDRREGRSQQGPASGRAWWGQEVRRGLDASAGREGVGGKVRRRVRVRRWKVLNAGHRYLASSLKAGSLTKDGTLSSFICWGINRTTMEGGRKEQGAC